VFVNDDDDDDDDAVLRYLIMLFQLYVCIASNCMGTFLWMVSR
jgi:hypothetical protein